MPSCPPSSAPGECLVEHRKLSVGCLSSKHRNPYLRACCVSCLLPKVADIAGGEAVLDGTPVPRAAVGGDTSEAAVMPVADVMVGRAVAQRTYRQVKVPCWTLCARTVHSSHSSF